MNFHAAKEIQCQENLAKSAKPIKTMGGGGKNKQIINCNNMFSGTFHSIYYCVFSCARKKCLFSFYIMNLIYTLSLDYYVGVAVFIVISFISENKRVLLVTLQKQQPHHTQVFFKV